MENQKSIIEDYQTQTNTQISVKLKSLAQMNRLRFNECLEFGIKFKLAEIDEGDYPESKLIDNFNKVRLALENATQELEKLKNEKTNSNSTRLN